MKQIVKKRILPIFLIGLLSFFGNWLFSIYQGIPVAKIHDEFSYLLAADTFAHGRVTNPTHPMWQHFETFHVLQQPTYMSKYPPAQGFFMAIGQVICGHAIYGVWLSAALMCMAICWMLFAWVPTFWALIGGLVAVLQFGVFTYWSQSYWGGAVAALGGALVFGALPRIFKYQRVKDVMWLGLGIAILVNSRPIEGILIGIPIGCLVLPWKIKWERIKNAEFVKRIVLPFVLLLTIIIVSVGLYNKAVTGKASEFPQRLYAKTQTAVPLLIWQPLRQMPQFNHQIFVTFEHEWSQRYYLYKRTWKGFIHDCQEDIGSIFFFFFGFVLAIPSLLILIRILRHRQRRLRFILGGFILVIMIISMTCMAKPHYFSPYTCLAILMITLGLRTLSWFKVHQIPLGRIIIICALVFQLFFNIAAHFKPSSEISKARILQSSPMDIEGLLSREELTHKLLRLGGQHLVLVQYSKRHSIHNEWVYNGSNIDQSPIVWARSMGIVEDEKLLKYYKNRNIWHIEVSSYIPKDPFDRVYFKR